MRSERHVGRASVRRRPRGRARVGPVGVASVDPQQTTALKAGERPPPPVFVDASGRRHRGLRRLGIAAGIAVVLLLVALWVTQLGHPVRPDRTTPCPGASAATATSGTNPACGRR
jgi:hypothetical protein